MKECNHKVPMTPDEEKALNESIIKAIIEGFDIIRERFPGITTKEDLAKLASEPGQEDTFTK